MVAPIIKAIEMANPYVMWVAYLIRVESLMMDKSFVKELITLIAKKPHQNQNMNKKLTHIAEHLGLTDSIKLLATLEENSDNKSQIN